MALKKQLIREKYTDVNEFFLKESGNHRCHCGCSKLIEIKESHFWNGVPRFIFGHAARLRKGGPSYDKTLYYCVEDIARMGDFSEQTVRLWVRKGEINPVKTIGRKNLFDIGAIDEYLDKRPKRIPFNIEKHITIQELKKIGVSRSKLRVYVRVGKIREPRMHARKTNYLLADIEKYWSDIQEDRKKKRRRKISVSEFKETQDKVRNLERRVFELEKCILAPDNRDKMSDK